MYSVVLMMAMTSGGDVADFGHRHGGCCGGESYSSCCGASYSACCGGERHRLFGGRHRHGCCGGYSGCCGGYVAPVDCGCGAPVYTGCTGGVVTEGVHEEPIGAGKDGHEEHHVDKGAKTEEKVDAVNPEEQKQLDRLTEGKTGADKQKTVDLWKSMSHKERADFYKEIFPNGDKKDGDKKPDDKKPDDKKPDDKKDKKDDGKDKTMISAPATIIVSLPADAKLSIDDAVTTSTASTRVFTSPVLPAGHDYHYTLKAEMVRNGKSVVVSKEVTVRAGEATRVNLEAGLAGVASR